MNGCRPNLLQSARMPKNGWKMPGWPQKPPLKGLRLSLPSGEKQKVALSRPSQSVPKSWQSSTDSCRINVMRLNRFKSRWSRPDWPLRPLLKGSRLSLPSGEKRKVVWNRPLKNVLKNWRVPTKSCRASVTSGIEWSSGWKQQRQN